MARSDENPATLNKMSLADLLANRTGLGRAVAYDTVETIFDIIAGTVAVGGSVSVTNFGSFSLAEKKSRMARNPHTNDPIEVPARKAPKWVASPRLKAFANSEYPELTTIRKSTKVPVAS